MILINPNTVRARTHTHTCARGNPGIIRHRTSAKLNRYFTEAINSDFSQDTGPRWKDGWRRPPKRRKRERLQPRRSEKKRDRKKEIESQRDREGREEGGGKKRGKKEGKNGDGLPPPSLPRLVSSQPETKREVREATHSSEKIMQTVRKRRGIPQSPRPRLIATNPFRPFPVLTFQHAGLELFFLLTLLARCI